MIVQDPIPPVPPIPPDFPDPVIIHDGAFGVTSLVSDELLIAIVLICALIGAVYILGPIARAYARRMERHGEEPEVQAELQSLRDRIGEVDQLRERMLELEERVDFAERLLARPADARAAALPAPEERR